MAAFDEEAAALANIAGDVNIFNSRRRDRFRISRKSFHIDFSKIVSSDGRRLVTEALERSGCISSLFLILPENALPEDISNFLSSFVARKKSLSSIDLLNNHHTDIGDDECIGSIIQAIAENRNMRSLDMDDVGMGTNSSGLIHSLLFLQHLKLCNVLSSFDGSRMCQLIENPKCHLVRLVIGGSVQERMILPILATLKHMGSKCSVKHFGLDFDWSGEEVSKCIRTIAQSLGDMTSLTSIGVDLPSTAKQADEDAMVAGLLKNFSLVGIFTSFSDSFEMLSKFIVSRNEIYAVMDTPLRERLPKEDLIKIVSACLIDGDHGLSLCFFVLQKNAGVVFSDMA